MPLTSDSSRGGQIGPSPKARCRPRVAVAGLSRAALPVPSDANERELRRESVITRCVCPGTALVSGRSLIRLSACPTRNRSTFWMRTSGYRVARSLSSSRLVVTYDRIGRVGVLRRCGYLTSAWPRQGQWRLAAAYARSDRLTPGQTAVGSASCAPTWCPTAQDRRWRASSVRAGRGRWK